MYWSVHFSLLVYLCSYCNSTHQVGKVESIFGSFAFGSRNFLYGIIRMILRACKFFFRVDSIRVFNAYASMCVFFTLQLLKTIFGVQQSYLNHVALAKKLSSGLPFLVVLGRACGFL